MPASAGKIEVGAETTVGLVRLNNEDRYFCDEDLGLFVVADGMGGHASGEVASSLAVETIAKVLAKCLSDEATLPADVDDSLPLPGALLKYAIREANRRVLDISRLYTSMRGMGTTVTAALVRDSKVYLGQVGDSRGYLIREGKIK
ncbi:MAG: PP2C family protein-serine/threonine phosphatase [bacterium]